VAPGAQSSVNVELFGHTLNTLESLGILCVFGVLMFSIAIQSFRKQQ
jgi:hypothetical protein